jgi:hypothetical protein
MKLNDKLLLLESKGTPFYIRPEVVRPSKPATLSTAKKTCKTKKRLTRDQSPFKMNAVFGKIINEIF